MTYLNTPASSRTKQEMKTPTRDRESGMGAAQVAYRGVATEGDCMSSILYMQIGGSDGV